MLSNIDAVIFDLDGTLIDSVWIWEAIDIAYLGQFGLSCPDDLQQEIEGMSFDETACYFQKRFGISDSIQTIQQTWNAMAWEKYEKEVPLKPGARAFLEQLQQKQIACGIASSNSKELIALTVEKHGLLPYFQSIRHANEVHAGKPAPDLYFLVAEDLGVAPERCLVLEDVLQGVKGGKNARMRVGWMENEFVKEEREQIQQIADFVIPDFTVFLEDKG